MSKLKRQCHYTRPPKKEGQIVPKFELLVDYVAGTWDCIVDSDSVCMDYDGTFSVNHVTGQVHIEWYDIPLNDEFWEEVESQLRTLITTR